MYRSCAAERDSPHRAPRNWLGRANAAKNVVEEAGRKDLLIDGAERNQALRSAWSVRVAASSFMRPGRSVVENEIAFRRR